MRASLHCCCCSPCESLRCIIRLRPRQYRASEMCASDKRGFSPLLAPSYPLPRVSLILKGAARAIQAHLRVFLFFHERLSRGMKRFLGKDVCSVTRFTSGHSTQEKMSFHALHIQRFVRIGYHIQGMNFLARWANGWNLYSPEVLS